jgi:Fe-S-cluster containining protein
MCKDDPHSAYTGRSEGLGINEEILFRIDLLKSFQEDFECKRCGECCKQQSIAFTERDILLAANKTNLSSDEFIERFSLSPVRNPGELEFYRLTIGKVGICPFCSDRHCTIYDARPQVCRGFPFLTQENVQAAFKMESVVHLGGYCKAAVDLVEKVYKEQMEERTK